VKTPRWIRRACFGVAALLVASVSPAQTPSAAATPTTLITLEADALEASKKRLAAGDAALQRPFDALKRRADKALDQPLRSVTHKTMTPPSGDKHDYISMGPYWWPNPNTADGLPYIRRDGQRNPQVTANALDADRLQAMIADTRDLTLAHFFTGQARYAAKAVAVLRAWFLDPATRMNPHLRFAQGIPGIVEGRGIGLIDTRELWWVIDSVALLSQSGQLSAQDLVGLRQWFKDYVQWMLTSDPGREEFAAYNNHGMFYDAQVAPFLLFVGQTEQARRVVFQALALRFGSQIDRQGRLPFELERTRPFHYTTFTLQAATRLARYGELLAKTADTWAANDPRCAHRQFRCPLNLWGQSDDGRSLAAAVDFMARAIVKPQDWTLATPEEPKLVLPPALPVLLMARRALGGNRHDEAIATLRGVADDDQAWLLWPAR
jgi:Alginate lyase